MEHPKKILQRRQRMAHKKLGQNFLCNKASAQMIYRFADIPKKAPVIEIGPGLGSLTEVILEQGHPLLCLEKDRDCVDFILNTFESYTKHSDQDFECLEQDVLKWSARDNPFVQKYNDQNICIISNLPYHISTPIIEHLFEQKHCFKHMSFLLQKEFVDRVCADFNSKTYGRLSVWLQSFYDVVKGPVVSADSFYPKPKVASRLLKMQAKTSSLLQQHHVDENIFFEMVRIVFSQRRKTIKASLKSSAFNTDNIPDKWSGKRPEELSIDMLLQLAKELSLPQSL